MAEDNEEINEVARKMKSGTKEWYNASQEDAKVDDLRANLGLHVPTLSLRANLGLRISRPELAGKPWSPYPPPGLRANIGLHIPPPRLAGKRLNSISPPKACGQTSVSSHLRRLAANMVSISPTLSLRANLGLHNSPAQLRLERSLQLRCVA
ncbi:hypothetical protein RRG08_030746 [Elysia crispata]|uniref:Uncharacterized protein n=1 Tax=Elysia crispata TaxID=231223 RepID=A0AAE1AND3_9GAST|nr:hypothetical protein RRG08_030746 [Elysia crispata]